MLPLSSDHEHRVITDHLHRPDDKWIIQNSTLCQGCVTHQPWVMDAACTTHFFFIPLAVAAAQ